MNDVPTVPPETGAHLASMLASFPRASSLIEAVRSAASSGASLNSILDETRRFLLSHEPLEIVMTCLRNKRDDLARDNPVVQQDHIVLCRDKGGVIVALAWTENRASNAVYSTTSEALIGAVSKGGFAYKLSPFPPSLDPEVFSADVTIDVPTDHHCPSGEAVVFPCGSILQFEEKEKVILKVLSPPARTLIWEFNRTTRLPVSVTASTNDVTIATYVLRFLAVHGNGKSASAAMALLAHPHHHVRWETVKALGRLDPRRMREALVVLRDDPHPHVSHAAHQMLMSPLVLQE